MIMYDACRVAIAALALTVLLVLQSTSLDIIQYIADFVPVLQLLYCFELHLCSGSGVALRLYCIMLVDNGRTAFIASSLMPRP